MNGTRIEVVPQVDFELAQTPQGRAIAAEARAAERIEQEKRIMRWMPHPGRWFRRG